MLVATFLAALFVSGLCTAVQVISFNEFGLYEFCFFVCCFVVAFVVIGGGGGSYKTDREREEKRKKRADEQILLLDNWDQE